MSKNLYDGVNSYAISFVAYKAKLLTKTPLFRKDDFEDLQQDLMLAYLKAMPSFDESKGDIRSFIKASVNNAAINIIKAAESEKRWSGQSEMSLHEVIASADDSLTLEEVISNEQAMFGSVLQEYDQLSSHLQIDMDKAIALLKPKQAEICKALKEKTVAELADESGISRGSINNALKNLREIAEKLGLEIYL